MILSPIRSETNIPDSHIDHFIRMCYHISKVSSYIETNEQYMGGGLRCLSRTAKVVDSPRFLL